MSFQPDRLFIGVVDLFAVLLPGALLTFVLQDDLGPSLLGDSYPSLSGSRAWIAFALSSYLVGHLLFLLGSWGLDDQVDDRLRGATHGAQIRRLAGTAEETGLSPAFLRWAAARLIKPVADRTLRQAVAIKRRHLQPLEDPDAINAFQWCKARLNLEQPSALPVVQRFEADSKFFRSLVIALCLLVPIGVAQGRAAVAVAGGLLVVPAFWRYMDQRVKATNQAFWFIITLEAAARDQDGVAAEPAGPSHAGGVVFRRCGGEGVEFLLVRARPAADEWVLPKGHIEGIERPQETAVREVREETGVWARVHELLETVTFQVDSAPVVVEYYLMEAVEEGRAAEGREVAWRSPELAAAEASHDESQAVLEQAARRVS